MMICIDWETIRALDNTMADITNVFKATVKTIRVREKSLGAITGVDKNILPPCRKTKTEFTANALEVVGKYRLAFRAA